MVGTELVQGHSVVNAKTFVTGVVRPGAGVLLIAFVASSRGAGLEPPAEPSLAGGGLQWDRVATLTTGVLNERRLTCLRAVVAAPLDDTITIGFGAQEQDYCAWSVAAYDRIDAAGSPDGTGIVVAGTGTAAGESLTITPVAATNPRNALVGALMLADFNGPVREVDPTPGFVETAQQNPNQGFGGCATLQTQDIASVPGSVTWTWTGAVAAVAITVEIAIAADVSPPPPSDPIDKIIRRFEPILHLHPEEQFAPVDAKRYIEHAALWRATAPRDDNDNWGGAPLVDRDKLSASPSEPGEFLGRPDLLVSPGSGELFLELGGWKDSTETAEPDVTDTSANTYSNSELIASRYRDEPALRDSRFWYHAEYFDSAALVRMAGGAPDYTKTLQFGLQSPSLLCYYLFFPHHRQTIGQLTGTCTGQTAATEISSHAGDWHCVAILLDGDGTAEGSEPAFIGLTGPGPGVREDSGTRQLEPHQTDPEGASVMRVEAWQPAAGELAGLPLAVDRHARLFVAEGSHGLYLNQGEQEIYPYTVTPYPYFCGGYDSQSVAPPGLGDDDDDFLEDLGAWLGILLASFSLGFTAGVVIAAVAERIPWPSGLDIVGSGDVRDPDRTAGGGMAVVPHGIEVAGSVSTEAWRSQQKLVIDGRQYDMRVDRENQIWWPGTDGESGFRGRWGQRVTSDTVPRRSGPLFPDFARMFLAALEDGRTRGFFP